MLAYRFGDWLIEPHLNRLTAGGRQRKLPPKAMDLLVCLLNEPGDVVSTEELLQRAWPGQVVEDNGVQQRIWMIRKCLGDDARNPTYIQSVAKRGYRTIAAVERVSLDNDESMRSYRPWMVEGSRSPSIAVLPFVNMGGLDEQEHFLDGLAEDIITDLSQLPGLAVVSRHSAFAYKGHALDARTIGRELNVSHLLEGSVRRLGNNVRVAAQLIDTVEGLHVWAKRYDRTWHEVLELQDELTSEIVTALDIELVSGERGRYQRARLRGPEGAEALYRGLAYFNRFTEADNARARAHYGRFVRIEPESILGYIQLAACHQQELLMGWSLDEQRSIDSMGKFVEKALAIDACDPSALGYAGMHQLLLGNHDASIDYAERARQAAPQMDAPYYTLGWYQMFSDMPLEAIENLKHSIRLIPLVTAPRLSVLGTCYRNSGQTELAVLTLEESVRRDPSFVFARAVLASTYSTAGDLKAARREVREILQRDSNYTVSRYMNPNLYRHRSGKQQWADALALAGLPAS